MRPPLGLACAGPLRSGLSVLVLWLTVLFAGHPLVAHAVGSFAVEVFPGGLFGLRLGGIEGWHGGGFGALFRPARCWQ